MQSALVSRRCGASTMLAAHKGNTRSHVSGRKSVSVAATAEPGPLLKRPELKRPERKEDVPSSPKLFAEEPAAAAAAAPVATASTSTALPVRSVDLTPTGVTVEFQRQKAKELAKYFQSVKFEDQIVNSKVFGWTPENEINNGRWVMMGIAIGLLTEYATGVDFVKQLGMIVTYLGIVDLD